jgi:hypothetical protein
VLVLFARPSVSAPVLVLPAQLAATTTASFPLQPSAPTNLGPCISSGPQSTISKTSDGSSETIFLSAPEHWFTAPPPTDQPHFALLHLPLASASVLLGPSLRSDILGLCPLFESHSLLICFKTPRRSPYCRTTLVATSAGHFGARAFPPLPRQTSKPVHPTRNPSQVKIRGQNGGSIQKGVRLAAADILVRRDILLLPQKNTESQPNEHNPGPWRWRLRSLVYRMPAKRRC